MSRRSPKTPQIIDAIKKRMEELNWSQKTLADRANIPPPTVNRILSGESENPRLDNLTRLTAAVGLKLEELLTGQAAATMQESEYRLELGRIPLVTWEIAANPQALDDIYISEDAVAWFDSPYAHSSRAFCLEVLSPAMAPEYREHEIILVDPAITPQHGDDVIYRTPGGTLYFRRLQVSTDGDLLQALNPHLPNSLILVPPCSECLGVVVASWMERHKRK